MANEEQLAILRQGVEVWNEWRYENPEVEIDLTESNFQRAQLSRANFHDADLCRADFTEANAREVFLRYANMGGANLTKANLIRADLTNADLTAVHLAQANLSGANLMRANLSRANLEIADLSGSNLSESNLAHSILRDAKLMRANLSKANLSAADLSGARLSDANLIGAYLNKANLTGVVLNRAKLTGTTLIGANLSKTNLGHVNLTRANLSQAQLNEAHLEQANLDSANLAETDLRGANLNRAILRGTDLWKANLKEADLRQANFSGTFLRDADLISSDFSNAYMSNTVFGYSDLSQVTGLKNVYHRGPSTIGTDTIVRSKGRIPEVFLRGCGLSDWEIEQAKLYNPDLSNDEITQIQYRVYELRATQALQISPLFISYSHSDGQFVDKMGDYLSQKGIRYWRDIHNARAGRLEKQIDRAIRQNPTVLLVLSEQSLTSDWVEHEVRTARTIEKDMGRDVLCPVALDDSWKSSRWPRRILEQIMEYNILDFSEWRDDSKFHGMFRRLIDGLELFYKG